MQEWRRLEQARVYRLRDVQCQARVLYVRLDGLTAIREQLEARVQVSAGPHMTGTAAE